MHFLKKNHKWFEFVSYHLAFRMKYKAFVSSELINDLPGSSNPCRHLN